MILGNHAILGSVNANREHFEMGIRDLALGETMFPGVLEKILTNPVDGLEVDVEADAAQGLRGHQRFGIQVRNVGRHQQQHGCAGDPQEHHRTRSPACIQQRLGERARRGEGRRATRSSGGMSEGLSLARMMM